LTGGSRKYLVTGGSGFIGSALVKSLLRRGHQVRVFDDNSRGSLERLRDALSELEFVSGDIRDPDQVRRACAGMDAVCHLAYINGTEYFYSKPALVLEVGVKGMLNVLDGCRSEGVSELLLMSSSEVYQTPPVIPTPENVPLIVPDVMEARYSYGGGKIISELLAINYGRNDFSRVLVVRPHNVYGPDMGFQHVIPQFALRLEQMLAKQEGREALKFPIQGSGQETRSFVYIDDFSRAMEIVLDRGEHLQIYHLGTDEECAISDVARLVARSMGATIEVQPGQLLPGSSPRRCPDISKIRQLGFEPAVTLADGIDRYVGWLKDRPLSESTTEERTKS
jgi:nucleoside-diphosphate-sugar epimerase